MKPLVSIIIPIYNKELYVEECLMSVINQSYRKIEIICINDGSTDNSILNIEKFIKKDKRIFLYEEKTAVYLLPEI